jgi:hypothetical protein
LGTLLSRSATVAAFPIQVSWAADSGALAGAIADSRLLGVYATWLALPEFPALPPLASIDRAEMARIWPNLVVVERTLDRRLRYRAAGPEVVDRLGRDIAGLFLDEIMTGSSLSVLIALYDLTAAARAAVYSRTSLTTPTRAGEMVVHRLMLPLSNDRQRVDLILAAQTFETAPGVQADFTIGTQKRMEWNCQAWVDASQATVTWTPP